MTTAFGAFAWHDVYTHGRGRSSALVSALRGWATRDQDIHVPLSGS